MLEERAYLFIMVVILKEYTGLIPWYIYSLVKFCGIIHYV